MSSTVDQRVVEMRFDNSQFEQGAKQSISTLDKLKKALSFSDTSNTFSNLQKAADGVNLDGLGKNVDSVKLKFSALQVGAAAALSNIVTSAMNAGGRILKAFSLDQITSGFQEYELKMGSIQTILANTQSRQAEVSQEAIDSVNATADQAVQRSEELNTQLITNVQKAHAQQMKAFNESAKNELKAFDKSSQARLKALDKQFREEQKQQSKNNQKEIEDLNKAQKKKLEKLQDQLEEEQEAYAKSYEKKYDAFVEGLQKEMKAFREAHQEKLDLYYEEYLQQIKAADEERYKQIKAIDDQIDALNGLTKAEKEAKKAAKQQETLSELQRAVEIAKNSASRRKAEKELADFKDELAQEAAEKEREQQIEALEAQKDNINDEFEKKKEQIQKEYKARQEAAQESYEKEYEALEKQQKTKLEAMQETHKKELEALQEQQKKRLENLQEEQKKEQEALSERIQAEQEALSDRQSDEREALSEQINDQKEAISERQDAERDALSERQQDELNAIAARHSQELANIEAEKNARVKALQESAGKTEASSLEDVNKALDELNEYSDKTIYNFAEMTRNIGTFTAAGVDLDTSVKAIKGIANLAALSGSSSQQASTAMYQLSQAIAAGKANLQDWNSVVNAGMGGKTFQESLKETARVHGVAVDEMIAKNGSFRESIREGWITSDILLETLSKFTGDLTAAQLKSMGYTDEQVKDIQRMAKTAVSAATEVKTFSQLLGSLSESAGSGWAQTFEIIFGNFEEAKALWTDIYKVLDNLIGSQADARNELLKSWKDLGGRQAVVDGLRNAWEALVAVAKPIKEAFRNVFPPATAEGLVKLSEGFRDLTAKMVISEKTSETLEVIFTALFTIVKFLISKISLLFAAFKAGVTILTKIASLISSVCSAVIELAQGFADAIVHTDKFALAVNTLKAIFSSLKNSFSKAGDFIGDYITNLTDKMKSSSVDLSSIGPAIVKILSTLTSAFGKFAQAIVESVRAGDLERAINIIKGVIGTILGINLNKLVKSFRQITDKGVITSLNALKKSLVDTFSTIQQQIKSKALMNIAKAIGILVAAIVVLSFIDSEKLDASVGSIIILFAGLGAAMKMLDELLKNDTFSSVGKLGTAMVGLGAALLLMSAALKVVSTIDANDMSKSLNAITSLGLELTACIAILQKASQETEGAKIQGLISFAISMGLLVLELKFVSTIDEKSMNRGLSGMQALAILMASVITELQVASSKYNEGSIKGLISFAIAMGLLVLELQVVANMDTEKLKNGLLGMLGLAAIIAVVLGALTFINGKVKGASLMESAASVLVMAAAILILAPALKLLATMDMDDISRALKVLAGTFTIIGVAGLLLTPLAPVIVALASAIKSMGIAALAAGVGVNLLAIGLPLLAIAGVTSAAGLIAALSELVIGLLTIVRDSAGVFAEAAKELIKALCDVIISCSYDVAEALLVLLDDSLKALVDHIPSIIDNLVDLIILILDGLSEKMPQLVQSVVNLFVKFFESITDAVAGITTDSLEKALTGVGILASLMTAFAGLSLLAGAATSGVIAFGKFVGELAIAVAAAGAIYKIPGVSWLLESGGEFLYKLGDAIGKFVGGVVGGLINGFTQQLPEIALNLSQFMVNLTPFLTGARMIDETTAKGVAALADMIMTITQAAVIEGLASWFTGENNLEKFGEELAAFGPKFMEYYNATKGIKGDVLETSTNAAKALAALANNLPNRGGLVSWFAGENSMEDFGRDLVAFGGYLKDYANKIKDIKPKIVTASADCAKALVELANRIPNTGGLISLFTGDNNFAKFGESLKSFGTALVGYYNQIVKISNFSIFDSVVKSVTKLINMARDIEGIDTSKMAKFGSDLKKMGDKGIKEFLSAFQHSDKKVQSAVKAFATYLVGQLDQKLPKSNFTSRGKLLAEGLANGMNAMISHRNVRNAAKSLADTAKDKIKSVLSYDNFHVIGENVAVGLANGITSKINDIANAAIDAAWAAVDNARWALGVYSPSRVFTEIGQFVSIGLANGITDKISVVAQAGDDLAQGAIDPVQMAMDHIADIIENDDLVANPSIIPTIDLSQVIDGANQISSMFGGLDLSSTASLAQGAYASFGRTAASGDSANTNKLLTDKLDKLIDVTSDEARTENYNNFYIQSTDPQGAAEEVGRILQRQVERGRAAWAR